ncbi:MAG: glycosyltransferase [Opitutaceae bacterium]|nr:glycosyltransferase [Opitutaceae bacterium]MBP9912973.1 glycosyltransferase [Opitutaceae bacterium]
MKPMPDKRRTPDLPKRILFLNDVGFQYGAGIAQARQLECIMGLGIEAGVLTWAHGDIPLEKVATRMIDSDLWLGIRQVNHLEGNANFSPEALITGLLLEVARFNPEIVLVGNLHAARWPFQLLTALRSIGCRVLTFLHDAYLYTGRCAYPGSCQLYLTGCNDTCPTAGQYPSLAPALIADAWQTRRDIFGGPHGVEVIANSLWSKKMFQTALPAVGHIETIELSANEDVFKPADKPAARRLLGLPNDKPVVLCAAVNFQEERKGGRQLRAIIAALQNEVTFAAFGHNAQEIPGLIGLGYHLAADKIAGAYQAADIFLGTATEEAFGQTVMEAQLCGLPVVAFNAGGVSEIVRNEITGKLVRNGDASEAIAAIRAMLSDSRFMNVAAPWARQYALSRFSMWWQEQRWHEYFTGRRRVGTGPNPPTLTYPLAEAQDSVETARHRPSWAGTDHFINAEHAQIFEKTSSLPGWQTPGDSFKLYEMAYHAGDVILEIGTFGGRSATIELRGALANPSRTAPPQFYGIDIMDDSITRTRQILAGEMLGDRCHLFHGVLQDFVQRWSITPTMVFLDGDHSYEGCKADLLILSEYLKPGTPVLVHDFLNTENEAGNIGVKKAAREWEAAGHGQFMGCFGCCALYVTLTGKS